MINMDQIARLEVLKEMLNQVNHILLDLSIPIYFSKTIPLHPSFPNFRPFEAFSKATLPLRQFNNFLIEVTH